MPPYLFEQRVPEVFLIVFQNLELYKKLNYSSNLLFLSHLILLFLKFVQYGWLHFLLNFVHFLDVLSKNHELEMHFVAAEFDKLKEKKKRESKSFGPVSKILGFFL